MAKLSGFVEGLFRIDSCRPMDAALVFGATVHEAATGAQRTRLPRTTAQCTWIAAFTLLLLAPAGCKSEDFASPGSGPGPGPTDDVTLTVVVVSPTEVALSWTDPSTKYIQRPTALHSKILRDGVSLGVTNDFAFTDSGAAPSTQYCYRVLVVGFYQTLLGSIISYGWSSDETCVVTPGA